LLIYKMIKNKKFNYKIIPLSILIISLAIFNSHLFATDNIEKSIINNTYIDESDGKEKIDIGTFVFQGRQTHLEETTDKFLESSIIEKTFGLGVYYPKATYLYVEMDFFDILFQRGIYGMILYLLVYGYFLIKIVKGIFKSKENIGTSILFIISIALAVISLFFVGHVMFNMMPLIMFMIIINIFDKYLESKVQKW